MSSAYPAILRDEQFPVRLGPYFGEIPPDELAQMARSSGVIARVTIETDAPEYPLRRQSDTIYPTGKFTTALAGPDILALEQHGRIVKVHECATYILGRPFRDAMTALLEERARCANGVDPDGEAFARLVAQSFSGKLGQKAGGWVRAPEYDEPGRWGQYHILSERAGGLIRMRWIMGQASRWEQEKYPRGPHTASYAYLTAYCRQQMRRYRELCPAKSVVAQTTDGLWVLAPALECIQGAGLLYGTGPGYLRLDKTASCARFFGPRHYTYDGNWVLAGYHAPTVRESDMTARYTHRAPLSRSRERGAPTAVISVTRRDPVPTDLQLGRVDSDGWVMAPRIYGTRIQSWPKEQMRDD